MDTFLLASQTVTTTAATQETFAICQTDHFLLSATDSLFGQDWVQFVEQEELLRVFVFHRQRDFDLADSEVLFVYSETSLIYYYFGFKDVYMQF